MKTWNAAAVAAGRDEGWLHDLCADADLRSGARLVPLLDPNDNRDQLIAILRSHAAAPFQATLILVSAHTYAWARDAVPRLADVGGPVALVTRGLKIGAVRQLLSSGARDFIAASQARHELALRLWRLVANEDPPRQVNASPPARRHPRLAGLIGSTASFVRELDRLPALAGFDAGVLILGETGTGKELFAQALHYLGPRSVRPFVAVNCGALPAELVESELFGHLRGSFTSAHDAKRGLVAEAEGGSLFLDEVDSLPLPAQVKLLRFLQEKQYRPVGAVRDQQADVRVLAACNSDLWSRVERGTFRADLYYRLNVLNLTLPPLRERPEDVLPLAEHFLERYAREFHRPARTLGATARDAIIDYRWPGNVRELQHAIERGVLLASGPALSCDDLCLPRANHGRAAPDSFQAAKARIVEQFERSYIEGALARHGGNITHAAGAAVKNRRAFFELMKKHRIESGRFRDAQ